MITPQAYFKWTIKKPWMYVKYALWDRSCVGAVCRFRKHTQAAYLKSFLQLFLASVYISSTKKGLSVFLFWADFAPFESKHLG